MAGISTELESGPGVTPALNQSPEQADEARRIRRMQMMMNMVLNVIAQDTSLTVDQASQMAADARAAALAMFPGKELAFEIIWRPRLQRVMRDRFRLA